MKSIEELAVVREAKVKVLLKYKNAVYNCVNLDA